MKNTTKVGIVAASIVGFILTALFIFLIVSGYFANIFLPHGNVNTDEKLTDNSFNNTELSYGNLVLLNDKLYYNYNGYDSVFKYGTYEIGRFTSRRVDWEGPSWSGGAPFKYFEVFKGVLLIDNITSTGAIYGFRSSEPLYKLKNAKENKYQYFDIIDGKMFICSEDTMYVSIDGTNTKPILSLNELALEDLNSDAFCNCSIAGDNIAYVNKDGYVENYNYQTKQTVFKTKLKIPEKGGLLDDIIFVDNNILLEYHFSNESVFYNATENFKEIYSISDQTNYIYGYNLNAYGDKLYVSVIKDGIYSIDPKTGETRKIVSADTDEIYIFGDKWIYYMTSDEEVLYRTTRDGKTVEKIFG